MPSPIPLAAALLAAIALTISLPGPAARAEDTPIPVKEQFGFVVGPAKMTARSIGSYARGCLAGAKMLPVDGPAWQAMRLSRNRNWGHPELISWIERFADETTRLDGWPGLMVGDISQPRGGPMLTGHASHQIGLDADIWYLPMPSRKLSWSEREETSSIPLADYNGRSVIKQNWKPAYVTLLRRAAGYSEVERVFVHPAVKKALCDAETGDRSWLSKVRPIYGHNYHFHIRMRCPSDSESCKPQTPPTDDDGCGKTLTDWLDLVSKPPAKPKTAKKPQAPSKPQVRTIDWLPNACRDVLADGKPNLLGSIAPTSAAIALPQRKPRS